MAGGAYVMLVIVCPGLVPIPEFQCRWANCVGSCDSRRWYVCTTSLGPAPYRIVMMAVKMVKVMPAAAWLYKGQGFCTEHGLRSYRDLFRVVYNKMSMSLALGI